MIWTDASIRSTSPVSLGYDRRHHKAHTSLASHAARQRHTARVTQAPSVQNSQKSVLKGVVVHQPTRTAHATRLTTCRPAREGHCHSLLFISPLGIRPVRLSLVPLGVSFSLPWLAIATSVVALALAGSTLAASLAPSVTLHWEIVHHHHHRLRRTLWMGHLLERLLIGLKRLWLELPVILQQLLQLQAMRVSSLGKLLRHHVIGVRRLHAILWRQTALVLGGST